MKVSYYYGMARHLLAAHPHPDIAKVETFAEVGAVGPQWPPFGLKVTLTDGNAVWLAFNGAAPNGGAKPDQPAEFREEDLNVPCMR